MTETRWLTAAERAAWLRFVAVLQLLPAALDGQLNRDEQLTHFEYFCLAMLSEAPQRTLRMTDLAARTNATLPRLSRVIAGLESAGMVERVPCPGDRRATNAVLTDAGWTKIVRAAPGHVAAVREFVIDALTPAQLTQLGRLSERMLARLDPDGKVVGGLRRD
ncbi:MAG TPA: MarR family transcriptional regulator [Propionibacteriaceae bacterium]|nr:MarR family transcriptional regulator [Propionibacteriaceae bacterium]